MRRQTYKACSKYHHDYNIFEGTQFLQGKRIIKPQYANKKENST